MKYSKMIKDICKFYGLVLTEGKGAFIVYKYKNKKEGEFKIYSNQVEFLVEYYPKLLEDDCIGWEKELEQISKDLSLLRNVETIQAIKRYKDSLLEQFNLELKLNIEDINELSSFIRKYCKITKKVPKKLTRKDRIVIKKFADVCQLSTGEWLVINAHEDKRMITKVESATE